MSRIVTRRFKATGTLVASSPIHVGGLEAGGSDLPLATNGEGRLHIPGTSLAGPMRAWFAEVFDEAAANEAWGWARFKKSREEGGDEKSDGHASFITIDDAAVEGLSYPELRDGVGIDRFSGRAAAGIKFDRDILPVGTRFKFSLAFEDGGDETTRLRLHALLKALAAGDIRFGAAQTRGLGKLKLENCRIAEENLSSREGALAMIGGRSPSGGLERLLGSNREALAIDEPARIDIKISWRPKGPVMVKAGVDGLIVDILPLVSRNGDEFAQVLLGSGVKGALRSHAERILATAMDALLEEGDFLAQMSRHPLVGTLFGTANVRARDNKADDKADEDPHTPLSGRGALSVEDCFATQRIPLETWRRLLGAGARQGGGQTEDALLGDVRAALNGGKWRDFAPVTHVAIDRWTGGAAEGFLYSALEPWGAAWPAIEMTLHPGRLAPGPKKPGPKEPVAARTTALAAVALLILTLRDLSKKRIPFGFGGNRGMGAIEVTKIDFKGIGPSPRKEGFLKELADALKVLDRLALEPGDFKDPIKLKPLAPFDEAWRAYLKHDRGPAATQTE